MKQQETVDYFLKIVWQNMANKYNQLANSFGITQSIGYVLINVEAEGTAVTALANLLGVKATSLSRMLSNMEELGLIYRETAEGDKRSVKIFLTPFGIEKRKVARDVVVSFNEYLNQKLTPQEKEQLIKTLVKVNDLTLAYQPKK